MAQKRENSESVGNSSKDDDLLNRLEAFIKGGDCKEAYKVFEDCIEEAEKQKEHPEKCSPMLLSCMEAHPDYYRPFLEARQTAGVKIKRDFEAFVKTKTGESSEGYYGFMEGGGCKESYKAWVDCGTEVTKKNQSVGGKCNESFAIMLSCMEARRDYYHPYLEMAQLTRQTMRKEMEDLFLNKGI